MGTGNTVKWQTKEFVQKWIVFTKGELEVTGDEFARWMAAKFPEVDEDTPLEDLDSKLDQFVEDKRAERF